MLILVTVGAPLVMVPVLSKITQDTWQTGKQDKIGEAAIQEPLYFKKTKYFTEVKKPRKTCFILNGEPAKNVMGETIDQGRHLLLGCEPNNDGACDRWHPVLALKRKTCLQGSNTYQGIYSRIINRSFFRVFQGKSLLMHFKYSSSCHIWCEFVGREPTCNFHYGAHPP